MLRALIAVLCILVIASCSNPKSSAPSEPSAATPTADPAAQDLTVLTAKITAARAAIGADPGGAKFAALAKSDIEKFDADWAAIRSNPAATPAEYETALSRITAVQARLTAPLWLAELGVENADWPASVQPIPGGGAIVCGTQAGAEPGDFDMYVAKLGPNGETLWRTRLGGESKDYGASARIDGESRIIAVGQTSSFKDFGGDVYLARLDATGAEIWSRSYGKLGTDTGVDVIPVEGGYVVTGRTFYDAMDAYVLRVDTNGEVIWEKRIGGSHDQFASAAIGHGGGIVIAGTEGTLSLNDGRPWLLALDADGNERWRANPEAPGFVNPESVRIAATSDGGFALAFSYLTEDKQIRAWDGQDPSEDIYLMKLGAQGETTWARRFGGAAWDSPRGIFETAAGFVAVATTQSYGAGAEDILLFAAAHDGAELWARTFGTVASERARALALDGDGLLLAYSQRDAGAMNDATLESRILRADLEGYTWHASAQVPGDRLASIEISDKPEDLPPPPSAPSFVTADAPKIGDPAPEIHAGTWYNTDAPLTLEGLRGKVVVVEFWATWCGPCRHSTPHLVELAHTFKDRGVVIIGLSDEDPAEAPVQQFIDELKVDYPAGAASETIKAYGVTAIPTAFVVNRDGTIHWIGHPMDNLEGRIEEALAK